MDDQNMMLGERHFGYGIARAYAGHTDTTGPATTTYIKASLQEVATALAAMTGHPTPWPKHDPRDAANTSDQRLNPGLPGQRLYRALAGIMDA